MGHPYFPQNMTVINYTPNTLHIFEILGYFFGGLAVIMPILFVILTRGYKATLSRKLALCWLILCGCIHTILEGHFAVFHEDIQSRMDFLSQVCKY